MEFLGMGHLFRGYGMVLAPLLAENRSPRRDAMPAVGKLLVLQGMALFAIGRRQSLAEGETVMLHLVLAGDLLVAFETIHALFGVNAEFILVDNGIMLPRVALGTFARCLDECLARVIGVDGRALPVDQVTRQDEAEANDEGNKYRSK
jgi:hypothetical protein